MQKLKNLKLYKKSMVVAYWNRGAYKGPGTPITSDCCITIEFRNGDTFAELWASAREARDIYTDLKGKRMTVVSRTDYSREYKKIETSRDRILAASERYWLKLYTLKIAVGYAYGLESDEHKLASAGAECIFTLKNKIKEDGTDKI
jgi:hypothetical protein